MCLQAMTIVYERYYEDIGPFSDTKYIVGMLERVRYLQIIYFCCWLLGYVSLFPLTYMKLANEQQDIFTIIFSYFVTSFCV